MPQMPEKLFLRKRRLLHFSKVIAMIIGMK